MSARGVGVLALACAAASAQPPAPELPAAPAPDLGAWVCKFCPFDSGTSGWIEPLAGYVSDRSTRFGDWSGLDDRGAYSDFSGAWRYRDAEDGRAFDAHVERAGLEARALDVSGGRAGRYRVMLGYESLPHDSAGDTRTPFAGATLGLPASWTTAGSTGGMAGLDASLRARPLERERERTRLGFAWLPRRDLDLRLDYRREELRGTGAVGGSFMTLASQLPQPIDQTLDRVDASAALAGAAGQAQLTFGSSFFRNDVAAVAWQNPYNPPSPGATAGQLGQAPDNRAHRLGLSLGSAPGSPVQLSGQVAIGQLRQDARFLPATVNANETAVLPRASLDARVDTLLATARAGYAIGRALRVSADVLHDERDNRTPVEAYPQVVMDTFTSGTRVNTPFDYTRDRWRLSVERRGRPRLAVGFDDDTRDRRMGGRARTREQRYWGRLGWRPFEGADLRLKAGYAQRDGAAFADAPGALAQNPLMQAYNTADRQRTDARGDFSMAWPGLTAAYHVSFTRDRYPASALGRTQARDVGYGTDLMLQPAPSLSLGLFAERRRQESGQAGSQAFAQPDWFADLEDLSNVAGLRVNWLGPRGLELGSEYLLAESEGSIGMLTGAGGTAFPLQLTRWHDARLYGRYPLTPDLSLRLDLLREIYEARDWSLDGVAPDTVPNLLALGQGTQDGAVTAVLLGLRWQF